MNDKITQISSKRLVTEDFAPVWHFEGTVYFEGPLSDQQRKTVTEIMFVLNNLLGKTE